MVQENYIYFSKQMMTDIGTDLCINPILQAAVQNKQTSTCMTLVLIDLENKITTVLLLITKSDT